jgi:hypothetical protein
MPLHSSAPRGHGSRQAKSHKDSITELVSPRENVILTPLSAINFSRVFQPQGRTGAYLDQGTRPNDKGSTGAS